MSPRVGLKIGWPENPGGGRARDRDNLGDPPKLSYVTEDIIVRDGGGEKRRGRGWGRSSCRGRSLDGGGGKCSFVNRPRYRLLQSVHYFVRSFLKSSCLKILLLLLLLILQANQASDSYSLACPASLAAAAPDDDQNW